MPGLLEGVRVVECSMLGPAAITSALADLGADVIKIEPPQGDYVREMTWPIVEGVSLMHLHINRGKRSLVIDLRQPEGVELFLALVKESDVVVEAMRPGGLERRGLGFDKLREVNPRIVQAQITGYGVTGPYRDLASHGIAYDAWAGIFEPEIDEEGYPSIPVHVGIGIYAGPLYGALGILAAVIKARESGEGCRLELAQSDAAAAFDWYRSESYKAYERPQSEVTGNKSDDHKRRAPGIAGMRGGVRYQVYKSSNGYVLFMSSEQAFWKNFCEHVGRTDMFEKWPGSKFGDHAVGNREMQAELTKIFASKTTEEWIQAGLDADFPICPVNTPQTLADDPQFQDRLGWIPKERLGADQLPFPVKVLDEEQPVPTKAPTVGEHSADVLRDVLGYDDGKIDALREGGTIK